MKKILVGVLLAILVASFVMPYAFLNTKAQTTQYPRLSQIKVISYNGEDTNGIEAFTTGTIDMYTFPVPPSKITSLPSNVSVYLMPTGEYDVLLNPMNTTWGFNPFMFEPVRFAMNYVVDRSYFIDNILGGYGVPTYSAYAGEYEGLMTSNATAPYIGIHYNLTYANQTIYKTLTAHGAQYINGKWYYDGKPITIYFFVRTDTIIRYEYANFLIGQLEKLGFTVQTISGNLQKEITLLYSSDPANATWSIAIESWSGGYSYYDDALPIEFYSTWFAATPVTSNVSLSLLTFNDSKYELPSLFNTQSEIDAIALQLLNTNFNTSKQYYSMLSKLVSLGINESVRVFVAESEIPIYGSSQLQNVLPSIYYGTILNTPNYMTMSTPTGTATIGVRYLSQGAMNPGLGFTDAYSVDLAYGLIYPLSEAGPNGYAYPSGVILKVVNESNVSNIPVPTSALVYNTTSNSLQRVQPGTTAELAIIANFAPLIENSKFADGQNVTLADILNIYLEAAKMVSPNNSISDSAVQGFYGSDIAAISGFKILNSTAIEIWGNVKWFDPLYAAETLLGYFLPLGGYSPAGLFPWQEYSAMNVVVSKGLAAWDSGTASEKGIDWLSIVNPTDVSNILSALNNLSSQGYISKTLLQVQNLSGVTLVTPSEAAQGYKDLINFINTYGNAFVSNGPFILTSYSATSGGAILTRNPYFNLTLPSVALLQPMIYTTSISIPSIVSAGQTLSGTVSQTPDGSKLTEPAPNVIVYAQLISSNGTLIRVYNETTNSNGQFSITLPNNIAGEYYLRVFTYTYQNIFMDPTTYTLLIVPVTTSTTTTTTSTTPVTTTTTTSTTTTTTSTTTTTTSTTPVTTTTTTSTTPVTTTSTTSSSTTTTTPVSSSTTIAVAVVVVVIIIIIAAVLLIRRR